MRERIELGKMRGKRKKERVKRDTAALEQQVLAEVLPKGPKRFPTDFFPPEARKGPFKTFAIPQEPLRMGPPHFDKVELTTEEGFRYEAQNKVEAKFILYTQMAGSFIVQLPQTPIHVFKTVSNYEIYLRDLRRKLFEAFHNRSLNHQVAERLTEKVWQDMRLPRVEGA